jgi:hypothetical protein
VKIEQAKQRALKLFQRDDYQKLFELLHDEVYDGYGLWSIKDDDPNWDVSLKISDELVDFQLPFGDEYIAVMMTSFEIDGYSACIGSAFLQQDFQYINIAVGMIQQEVVIVYQYQIFDDLSPGNLYKNSDLEDIHEYHHRNDFYAMLDCYRNLLKLRKARDDERKEAELKERYAGKFSFIGAG